MNTNKRLTNWDLLRALSMFLVVVVHIAPQLGSFRGINAGVIVGTGAIICDPIFFCLSGYFALKPLKKSYKDYLFGKALSLLLPIFVYAGLLYTYKVVTGSLQDSNYIRYTSSLVQGGWWFIPALIPCILVAPVLSKMFDALNDRTCKTVRNLRNLCMGWTVIRCVLFALQLSACHPCGSRKHASKHGSQIVAWRNLFHVLLHGLFHQTCYPVAGHA